MTKISGDLMDEITNLLAGVYNEEDEPAKIKSSLYKKVISYNGLVNATLRKRIITLMKHHLQKNMRKRALLSVCFAMCWDWRVKNNVKVVL